MRAYLRLRAYLALARTLAADPSCALAYVPSEPNQTAFASQYVYRWEAPGFRMPLSPKRGFRSILRDGRHETPCKTSLEVRSLYLKPHLHPIPHLRTLAFLPELSHTCVLICAYVPIPRLHERLRPIQAARSLTFLSEPDQTAFASLYVYRWEVPGFWMPLSH